MKIIAERATAEINKRSKRLVYNLTNRRNLESREDRTFPVEDGALSMVAEGMGTVSVTINNGVKTIYHGEVTKDKFRVRTSTTAEGSSNPLTMIRSPKGAILVEDRQTGPGKYEVTIVRGEADEPKRRRIK